MEFVREEAKATNFTDKRRTECKGTVSENGGTGKDSLFFFKFKNRELCSVLTTQQHPLRGM
jgi:hypothetical protein